MTATDCRIGTPTASTPEGPASNTARPWRDKKKYFWLLSLVVPLIPLRAAAMAEAYGAVFWWLGPIVILAVLPLLDLVFGVDLSNPPESEVPRLEEDRWYRWVLYAYLPLQLIGLVYAAYIISTRDLSIIDMLGYSLTVGVVADYHHDRECCLRLG